MAKKRLFYLVFFILVLLGGSWFFRSNSNITWGQLSTSVKKDEILKLLTLPDGFSISIFADIGDRLRQIAIADDGWLFVGTRGSRVYGLQDADDDGFADRTLVIADNLQSPHGVAYHQGDLYIGEIPNIYIVRDVLAQIKKNDGIKLEKWIENLPTSTHHGMRHLKIGPDNMLYIGLGVPCNICEPTSTEFMAVIRRYPLTQSPSGEVYARGVRNAVGFDFHPITGELWFTDNGRDWLGDDLPSDELNRVQFAGEHFGFPYCHQGDFIDPDLGNKGDCEKYSPPALNTGAHVANLGMAFNQDGSKAFIALHGSWNRSKKVGYAVYQTHLSPDSKVTDYQPFISGWLQDDESVYGRVVDIVLDEEETMFISDDFSGLIYRVTQN